MLTIDTTPRTTGALSLADSIKFYLDANGDSVDLDPVIATINVTVDAATGGGGADAQTITLFNEIFTTDSAQPFTFNTWDASGTPEEVANNFADLLRSNYLFRDFDIQASLSGGGVVW